MSIEQWTGLGPRSFLPSFLVLYGQADGHMTPRLLAQGIVRFEIVVCTEQSIDRWGTEMTQSARHRRHYSAVPDQSTSISESVTTAATLHLVVASISN